MNKYLILSLAVLALIIGGFFIKSNISGNSIKLEDLQKVTLKVSIPCEGHVYLIISELKKITGIEEVNYIGLFKFQIYYDDKKISEEQILDANIFKEYSAKVVN